MDRWPEYKSGATLRESSKSIDEYIRKLENRLDSLEHQLKYTKDEAGRMETERNAAVKELSVLTGKYAQFEETQGILRSSEASSKLFAAFEAAQFVMNDVRNVGSVREDDQSKDLKIQAMEQNLQAVMENYDVITINLQDEQEENEKLRGDIASLRTDLEIQQSLNIRFRNIFRDFAMQAQCNFNDTNQIIESISGSRSPSNAEVSQSSIQGSPDAKVGSQRDLFGFEGAVSSSVDIGSNRTSSLAEEDIFPEAFLEAVGLITAQEMAELEEAMKMV